MTIIELPNLIRSLTLINGHRNNKNKRYSLPLLLLIAFCASISKHDSWYTMQDYALAHEESIRALYKQLFGEELDHVTPSHDTLNRALQVIPRDLCKTVRRFPFVSPLFLIALYHKTRAIFPQFCRYTPRPAQEQAHLLITDRQDH